MKQFRSIVITGASSGIGEALALDYAAPGVALAITGRDAARLEAVATQLRARGATVEAGLIDAADREAVAAWLHRVDDAHPVDLLIANAGISIDQNRSSLDDFSVIRRTLDVNVGGVLNTVEPLVGRMVARRNGQIAIVSSLASFIGLPYSGSYNASKAAVRVWGESIRYALKPDNVGVTVVCPGFVVSRMTAKAPFPMPFLMTSAKASVIIRSGLARNKARIAFPFPTRAAIWLGAALPASWTFRLLAR
ncbi:MAG: SDR family NAD(P)-dependent oxidoreductase [Alphaproteobacteria bacterium]|nr:SDR family NAD(P)-dependent oxidoreductase [Alphaproteobacteria bacterium]